MTDIYECTIHEFIDKNRDNEKVQTDVKGFIDNGEKGASFKKTSPIKEHRAKTYPI